MKIYFAGSIRGGREDAALYQKIIKFLSGFGKVLTEHIGDPDLHTEKNGVLSDRRIHDRDLQWLLSCDVVVAEVTTVSMGVGYEIGRAIENRKKVFCLYRPSPGKNISAMIAGCPDLKLAPYQTLEEAKTLLSGFFKSNAG